eukprot:TRINITY_DN17320_c0_g1_i1.p1 TRINITY_DN17320_c0_g1~~TRINITY_DN17320_c0_g1_i1.p1  ORF type:complete len:192 (+),score=41.58 TRINITY_DN17320_c0_g1_i1:65-577(+)
MGGKAKGGKGSMKGRPRHQLGTIVGSGRGKIKMFDGEKGYGFVVDEDGQDIFFHRRTVPKLVPCPHCHGSVSIPTKPPHGSVDLPPGTLVKGGRVRFRIEMQPDGRQHAVDVQGDGVGPPRPRDEFVADPALPDVPAEPSVFECEGCGTHFSACAGDLVECPGCCGKVQL